MENRSIDWYETKKERANGRAGMSVLLHGQVAHKAPVAAGVDLDIADGLLCYHHVRLVPKRKQWHVAADNCLGLCVERGSLRVIIGIDGFLKNGVELLILIAAAVFCRATLGGDF